MASIIFSRRTLKAACPIQSQSAKSVSTGCSPTKTKASSSSWTLTLSLFRDIFERISPSRQLNDSAKTTLYELKHIFNLKHTSNTRCSLGPDRTRAVSCSRRQPSSSPRARLVPRPSVSVLPRSLLSSARHARRAISLLSTDIMACNLSTTATKYRKVAVSRLMGPHDANIAGNVHGGRILCLIEEAGYIITTEYCNEQSGQDGQDREPSVTQLARVEQTDFLQPMYIGEVAELEAEIAYTSPHSLQVLVTVCANNVVKGEHRITNRAVLWYVPSSLKDGSVTSVPHMTFTDENQEAAGRCAYLKQKEERKAAKEVTSAHPADGWTISSTQAADTHTVQYSQTLLNYLVNPSDCGFHGYCSGGTIMKMMDECAGITAAKHCRSSVVTACLNATNFHDKVKKGGLVTFYGRAVFASSKSIEIEVLVDVEHHLESQVTCRRAVDAFFTFVSLDKDRRTQPIPPLLPVTEEERMRFEEGRQRYEAKKRQRLEKKQSTSK